MRGKDSPNCSSVAGQPSTATRALTPGRRNLPVSVSCQSILAEGVPRRLDVAATSQFSHGVAQNATNGSVGRRKEPPPRACGAFTLESFYSSRNVSRVGGSIGRKWLEVLFYDPLPGQEGVIWQRVAGVVAQKVAQDRRMIFGRCRRNEHRWLW